MGHTVIQIAVPALESVVRPHVAVSFPGALIDETTVCAHVTLLGPFVDRHDVDAGLTDRIVELLAPVRRFRFGLTLVGGNLSSLTHMVGAGLPPLAGAIVLLEDKRDMGLGRVDRQLTQLTRSGSLDEVAGITLGLFSGFDGYEDRGWDLADVLHDHLAHLGVPVLGGLNVGHDGVGQDGRPDQVCLAVGGTATIDTATESIQSTV